MAKIRREFKNVVYNYTDAEVKVREATSNDPWGPSSTVMSELSEYTFHIQAYSLVMGMLWKRLNDHGKNWRHVYKSLVVLDYLVKNGSQRVVQQCKDNMFSIDTLKDFQYIDKDGKDQGTLIREKAKNLSALLKDDQKLDDERTKASKMKSRSKTSHGTGSGNTERSATIGTSTPDRGSSTAGGRSTTSPSGRFEQDHITQTRPGAKDEEDLQLQLALRMSKEQADKEEALKKQEEESLKMALELSKQEVGGDGHEGETTESQEDGGDDDLLGLGDPWEKPPSYDAVTTPPSTDDPWVPPVTTSSNPLPTNDPFGGGTDPFSTSPTTNTTTSDPWQSAPFSPPAEMSVPTFGNEFTTSSNDMWGSTSTTTTNTTMGDFSTTATPVTVDTLPPVDIGLTPSIPPTTTSDPYNFSAFNAPLDSMGVTPVTNSDKNTTVEESFLGSNAGLVNLDSLIQPLPPPTNINPFGLPSSANSTSTNSFTKSSNPFEGSKAPVPTLQQLQLGEGGGTGFDTVGFDPLPPPLLPGIQPTSNNSNLNPFSS